MDYCGPLGIPYLEFLGWDPLSRDAALAWRERDRARCGSCGTVKADWTDEDGNELVPPPLVVTEHWCPGCAALGVRRRNQGDKELAPGVTHAFALNVPHPAPDA